MRSLGMNASDTMIDIMAEEYACLTREDAGKMIGLLRKWTHEHDEKVIKRKRRKGIL